MHPAGKNKAATGKKKNTLNSEGGDPEAPNLAQWNRMHSYLEFDGTHTRIETTTTKYTDSN